MTSTFPHNENERQRSVNNFWSCILGNQGITQILELITELLTAFIGKNTEYKRNNAESKIIEIVNSKACKKSLPDVEYVILVRYYYQTARTRASNEYTGGPTGQPADFPLSSVRLGDIHRTLGILKVWVY